MKNSISVNNVITIIVLLAKVDTNSIEKHVCAQSIILWKIQENVYLNVQLGTITMKVLESVKLVIQAA